jgi:hypothetical protein
MRLRNLKKTQSKNIFAMQKEVRNYKIMRLVDKYFRDIIIFTILMVSLLSLIFKGDKTDSISKSLSYVIIGCLGYLFRGNK